MTTLELTKPSSDVQWCSVPLNWLQQKNSPPLLQPHTWVQLLDILNPYCHDEALLLCQISNWEWIAWIPDHGEATLSIEQFCVTGS